MVKTRRELAKYKCGCGSQWVTIYPTGRWELFIGWCRLHLLRDVTAKYLYGPYTVVCSKCKKHRRELEKRNYRE